jgi:hypothetical protein
MQITSLNDTRDAMDMRPLTEAELADVNGASIPVSFANGAIAGASQGVPGLYPGLRRGNYYGGFGGEGVFKP